MRGRTSLSTLLLLGAFVLLIAIAVGMNMGNRVLGQIGAHIPVQPTAVPAATEDPSEHGDLASWKRISVMSVATDPAFPDPRITPEPEVPATPRPRPSATGTPQPVAPPSEEARDYTSPPLPLPLVTHTPSGPETPGPDIEATPAPNAT
jgi:hypothetical protein